MKILEHHYSTFLKAIPETLKTAVPVDVSEVGNWYYKEAEIPILDFRKDFPTLVSPWMAAVYEYKFPQYFHSITADKKGWYNAPFVSLYGQNLCAVLTQEKITNDFQSYLQGESEIWKEIKNQYPTDTVSFRQTLIIFIGDKHEIKPIATIITLLDQDGRYLKMAIPEDFVNKKHQDAIRNLLYPIYFAINLMHCKNVRTVDTVVEPKLRKLRLKVGKESFAWKQIVIDSMRKRVADASHGGKGNTVNLALRIARGHWKDYTNGKGLFGKLRGRYWWDDIADGSLGRNYAIKAPIEINDEEIT